VGTALAVNYPKDFGTKVHPTS